jgi:hypothetical protein
MNTRCLLLLWLLLTGFTSLAQPGKPLPAGYLQWSATRRLQPSDFKLRLRQHNNLTESVGNLGLEVNGNAYDLLGKKANQVVRNIFNANGSYLDSANAAEVERQIRYLQTQWDIHEVAARQLRQELKASAKRIILVGKPDINDLIRAAYEKAHLRQIQYVDETRYGLLAEKQREWEQKLAAELTGLAAFAVPD